MFRLRVLGGIVALVLLSAACSSGGGNEIAAADGGPAADGTTTDSSVVAPADGSGAGAVQNPAPAVALLGESAAGQIIVGPDGRSLYGFTNDVEAASTCYDACATAWPPVIVDENWAVGPGLDVGLFATTVRDDGRLQLVAGRWPLYYYDQDLVPGDINGQGLGGVWFLARPDGSLITDVAPGGGGGDVTVDGGGDGSVEAGGVVVDGDGSVEAGGVDVDAGGSGAPAVSVAGVGQTALGSALVDGSGLTLYGFTNDVDGVPSCYDACADAWPPVLVPSQQLPAGLDPNIFSVVGRTDGTWQLVAGNWPLYRFAGDAAPGETNGQGSGEVWWVAAPDGSLIRNNVQQSIDSSGQGGAEQPAEQTSDGY